MNYYPHHIGDFNNATRHLTRVERSVYRDATELYYDTEKPLSLDIKSLEKKLICITDEEKKALKDILDEFFIVTDDGYFQSRCDLEIEKFKANISAKAKAGRASAEIRRQNVISKSTQFNTCLTGVQQSVNEIQLTKNQEPVTSNQEPIKKTCPISSNDKEILNFIWTNSPAISRTRSSKIKLANEWKKIKKDDKPSLEEIKIAINAWNKTQKWIDGFAEGIDKWVKNHQWENLPEPMDEAKPVPTHQTFAEINAKAKSDQFTRNQQNPLW